MVQLPDKVIEVELVMGYLLGYTPCFGFVVLFLRTFYQGYDITHAEYTVGHAGGMEYVQRLHLLTRTDELDWFIDHRADGQRRTASCIAVELGQYHAVKVETVVELLGGSHGVLTRHGIHDEQGLARLNSLFDG